MADPSLLYGLSKGVGELSPWVERAFLEKAAERERKQKFVSEYYMDLLKRGEIERELPAPIGPRAGPIPAGEESPLAGYLKPPATARPPTEEEVFNIMDVLSRGEGLAPGFRAAEPKIPKGLEPFQKEVRGTTYRRPGGVTAAAQVTVTPTAESIASFRKYVPGVNFEEGVPISLPVSSFNRYLTAVRGYKPTDIVKQKLSVYSQAEDIFKEMLKSPDVANLPAAKQYQLFLDQVQNIAEGVGVSLPEIESILRDPTTTEKYLKIIGIQPGVRLKSEPAPKAKVKKTPPIETKAKDQYGFTIGEQRVTDKGTYKYLGNNQWQKIK